VKADKVPEKTEKLKEIKEEIIGLKKSPLYEYRSDNDYFPVIGEGAHDADLMVAGEAPGKNEAKTGRPFCGRAGKVLDEMFEEAGMERKKAYVTNIVKDRPPENRDPTPQEIDLYGPFLDRQIQIIEPEVIATLGRFSANYMLEKFSFGENFPISKIHGQIYKKESMSFKIIPLFHPAASIYSPDRKSDLIDDFKFVKEELKKT